MRSKVVLFVVVGTAVVLIALLIGSGQGTDLFSALREADPEWILARIRETGPLGPLVVVSLIAMAIVVSPLPSAPIAVAAGALYGHFWGTLYVVTGAEVGALLAFFLSRWFGYPLVKKVIGDRIPLDSGSSQNTLMVIVFVTRLLPFLSFDVVSYAAGLTPLRTWRFALATLAGIVPMSFLLAHFGGEFASFDTDRFLWAFLALGVMTGLPLTVMTVRRRYGSREPSNVTRKIDEDSS